MSRIDEIALKVREAELAHQAARSDFRRAATDGRAAVAGAVTARRAHGLLTAFADSRREVVRAKVESIVAAAVRAVFGGGMDFKLEVSTKRGVVNMEPMVGYRSKSACEWRSVDDVGGGVADVVSFAMRLAVLTRYRPRLRKVLIADEPFKHVSAEYLPGVAEMLRKLCDSTGFQIIVVSHEPEIASAADRLYRVTHHPVKGSSIAVVDEDAQSQADDYPGPSNQP